MSELNDLSNSLRDRLPQLLGLALLVLVAAGELAFAGLQVLPAVRAYGDLSSQLAEARQAMIPPAREGDVEAALQAKLTKMQQTLDQQGSTFLAESEIPVVLNHLYRYADESGVQIMQIQAAPGPAADTKKQTANSTQSFQVQVIGRIVPLVGFVTALRKAKLPCVVLDHLVIKPGTAKEGNSMLMFDLLIYTSPYATGSPYTKPLP